MNSSDRFGPIPSEFILSGLSWIEGQKHLAASAFLLTYMMVIFSNCSIVTLVKTDGKLHQPMHVFISLLSLVDLSLSSCIIPKALTVLWFGLNTIGSTACLVQMYFLYALLGTQSSLFSLMSFDRYVAVCHPLRHSLIMRTSFVFKSVVFIVSCSAVLMVPLPALAAQLTFCKPNVMPHSYCEYVEVMKLCCGDMTSSIAYLVITVLVFAVGDNVLVVFSYVNILNAVHMLRSSRARWKTLDTCSSHAILLSLFYISTCLPLFLFLYHPDSPLYVKTAIEVISFLLLPAINPIVYGVRSKEVRDAFQRLYWKLFKFHG